MKQIILALLTVILTFSCSIDPNSEISTRAQSQFVLVGETESQATDIYFHGNDMYTTHKPGNLRKNGELISVYNCNTVNERGLLAVAIYNGEIVVYVTSQDGTKQLVYSDFQPLVTIPYTSPSSNRHVGGDLVVVDGVLYISTGYGASLNDAQDLNDLRGKLIRYSSVEESIIAYGLRNPFRFDVDNGKIWIADVGKDLREEISIIDEPFFGEDPINLGWPCREGTYTHSDTCGTTINPAYEYTHSDGVSITGGVVYNNEYYFCDHFTGFGGKINEDGVLTQQIEFPQWVTSMDTYNDSLFVITFTGDIYALDLTPTVPTVEPKHRPDETNKNTDLRMWNILGQPINSPTSLYIQNRKLEYAIPQ